jgi:hypothetical protein
VANSDITQHVHVHAAAGAKMDALVERVQGMEEDMKAKGLRNHRGANVCHTVVFVNRKRDAEIVAHRIEQARRRRRPARAQPPPPPCSRQSRGIAPRAQPRAARAASRLIDLRLHPHLPPPTSAPPLPWQELPGVRAMPLHGDLSQNRRDRVRDTVKAGRAQARRARRPRRCCVRGWGWGVEGECGRAAPVTSNPL